MLHAYLLQACCTPTCCRHVVHPLVAGKWHAQLLQTGCMLQHAQLLQTCCMPSCCRSAVCSVVAEVLCAQFLQTGCMLQHAQLLQTCCMPSCCRHVASPVKTQFIGPIQGDTHTNNKAKTNNLWIFIFIFIDLVIN